METVARFKVEVTPVNDAPEIYWRGTMLEPGDDTTVAVDEDADLLLDACCHDVHVVYPGHPVTSGRDVGLRIADVDAAVSVVSLSLVPRYGVIAVGRAHVGATGAGAARTMDGHDLPHATSAVRDEGLVGGPGVGLTLNGTVDELNALLATAVYRSSQDWYGLDSLVVTVDDGGHRGDGAAQSTSRSLLINVRPQNDPPTITLAGTDHGLLHDNHSTWEVAMREVDEDTPLPLDGIHVTDVDSSDTQGRGAPSSGSMASRFAAHAMVELYVEVTYGTLTFEAGGTGHVSGISVVEGYGTATGDEVDLTSVRTVTLRGEVNRLNEALAAGLLVYQGDQDWNGIEIVVFTVDDLGNTGAGGPQFHERRMAIMVTPVSDVPRVVMPAGQTGAPTDLGFLTVLEDNGGVIGEDCCSWTDLSASDVALISPTSIHIADADIAVVRDPTRWLIPNTTTEPYSTYTRWLAPAAAEGTQSTYTTHTDGDSSGAAHLEYQPVAGGPFDAEIRADDPLGAKYTVRIEVAHGTITLTRASDEDGSLTFGLDPSHLAALLMEDSDGVNDADLTFSGSLSDVNRALESCVYKSDLNW